MPYLAILKRFEIWLLLGVVVALLVFAFRTDDTEPPEEPEVVTVLPERKDTDLGLAEPEAGTELVVEDVEVTDTGSGKIVEVTLMGRSLTAEDLIIGEEMLVAMTDAGDPVPPFFEPFGESSILRPEEDSLVTAKFWLESPSRVLWLDLQGRKVKAELPE